MNQEFTFGYLREALTRAQRSGYRFISFEDAVEKLDPTSRQCILRHDCDNDLGRAVEIARIEKSVGVTSTFFLMLRSTMYNVLSWSAQKQIQEMIDLGHRIGLHFDEELVRDRQDDDVRRSIDFECEILERYFGQRIRVVSFHRPGQRILKDGFTIDRINTYDRKDMGSFQYISDSSHIMRIDLWKAFETGHFPKMHLNLHPEWWGETAESTDVRWREMLRNAFLEREDELWTREEAYLARTTATFAPSGVMRPLPDRLRHTYFRVG